MPAGIASYMPYKLASERLLPANIYGGTDTAADTTICQ
jgi:hypothetical protein